MVAPLLFTQKLGTIAGMLHPLVHFILNAVASDYVRLYKAGNAPPAEHYAEVWQEHAEALVHEILCTKFRLRRETIPALSVETFLQEHPTYWNNEDLLLRLLDHELETAPTEPDVATIRHRFPHVDPDRLTQAVELVQLRREWGSKEAETINCAPVVTPIAVTTDFSPQPGGDVTTDVPAATGAWTPEQAKSIEWSVRQSAQEGIDGNMEFSLVLDGQPLLSATAPPSAMHPSELREPQTFTVSDSLTVENFLGRGFWKDVYKAKQHSTQQYVALKHLREKNDVERASLIREVRTQASLTHQNIPPVFALDVLPSGQAIVVEKLVDGSRWSDTIQSRTLEDNLRILLEVANAVAFAHQQHKIIHRDLKPDNVVINDKYGEVYVIDWGLAVDVGDQPSNSDERVPHVSQLNCIAGTPLYWAPELADGTPTRCCPATDVFLLGAAAFRQYS